MFDASRVIRTELIGGLIAVAARGTRREIPPLAENRSVRDDTPVKQQKGRA
jgi:hypothetical protein